MASTRLGRAHTAAQGRARSPSPPPRSLSCTLRSGPLYHGTSSSSSGPASSRSKSSSRRSATPPPARAVAVPLQDQLAIDTELSLDLVKVQFKVGYVTSFGQQLKVVGGAPELGEWDLSRAPAMTWNEGHTWTLTSFMPPGTYPFKLVVVGPGSAESSRWEVGPNRSITIAANSPELGTAALILVDCDFDQTANTRSQTKRVTGIGFRSSSIKGNPHQSQSAGGSGGNSASLPSAAAFRTSKVTANAFAAADRQVGLAVNSAAAGQQTQQPQAQHPHLLQHQHQHQHQQQASALPHQPAVDEALGSSSSSSHRAPAAAARPAAPAAPGTAAFADRMAFLDSQLAELLGKSSSSSSPEASLSSSMTSSREDDPGDVPAAADAEAMAVAAMATAPAVEHNAPAWEAAAMPAPVERTAPAAAAPAATAAGAAASDATAARRVVSSFIRGHLQVVEDQALAMIRQNERLEARMAALEQHVQSYDDSMMGALADNLQQAATAAAAEAAAAAAPLPGQASGTSFRQQLQQESLQRPAIDASELVRQFMQTHSPQGSRSSSPAGRASTSVSTSSAAAAGNNGTYSRTQSVSCPISISVPSSYSLQSDSDISSSDMQLAVPAEDLVGDWAPQLPPAEAPHKPDPFSSPMTTLEEEEEEEEDQDSSDSSSSAHQTQELEHQQPTEQAHNGASQEHAHHMHTTVSAHLQQQQQGQQQGQAVADRPARVSWSSRRRQSADPQWSAAHARALKWASSLEPDADDTSESEPEEDEVPWWLADSLPAVRPSPRPASGSAPVGTRARAPYAHLKWSRSRVMSPTFAATAATLAERQQQQQEPAAWEDENGQSGSSSSSSSSQLQQPRPAFNGSGVMLAIATPGTAAAAAAAAGASPLVYNMQQHAYKAAKATGQSDQAAAIAATAAAARVAYGYPQPAAPTTSGSRRSSRGSQALPAESGPVAAVSAAVKARQQVLAVADVAVHLSVAVQRLGSSAAPDLSASDKGSGPDSSQASLDVRPETLGPRGLQDEALTLPSASNIAGSMLLLPAAQASPVAAADSASRAAETVDSPAAEEDQASEDELQELAALQQENQLLSELAGMHKQITALTQQAAALEEQAKQVLQPEDNGSLNASSSTTTGSGEVPEVGGVLGLALATKRRRAAGRASSEDVRAVRQLVEAMQLRMQAALLQKEAAAKQQTLLADAMHSRSGSPVAAVDLEEEEDEGDDSSGGGQGGSGSSQNVAAPAIVAAAAGTTAAASAAVLASSSSGGAAGAQPAPAAGSMAPGQAAPAAAVPAPGKWEREAITTVSAVAGVMSEEPPSRPGRVGLSSSSGGGCSSYDSGSRAFRAPGIDASSLDRQSAASTASSSGGGVSVAAVQPQQLAAAPAAASALPIEVQHDMLLMKDRIADLQARVSARRAHVAALSGNNSSSSATAVLGGGRPSPAFSAAGAAAAAAATAATAVTAVAAPGMAVAASADTVAAAGAAVARPAIIRSLDSMDEASGLVGSGVVGKSLPTARLVQSAAVALGSSGAGVVVASAAEPSGGSSSSSAERRSRWSSSVYDSPALVEDNSAAGRLAALRARTAAAVAAREELSVQARQALAALSDRRALPAAGSAAAAVARSADSAGCVDTAGSASSSGASDSRQVLSQRADRAQRAVAALSHWEVRAASAKQSLEALEQQAAAALAELEAHDAQTKARLRKRQLLAALKPPQLAAAAATSSGMPAGFEVSCVIGGVPDPALVTAAAVTTGVAAIQAVHQVGSHLLHNM